MEYDPLEDWVIIGLFFGFTASYIALVAYHYHILNQTVVLITIYGAWIMFLRTTEESFVDLWFYYRYKGARDALR